MLTTTIENFNKDVKKYIKKVSEDSETLIVNKGNNNGIVVMTLDEYNANNATFQNRKLSKSLKKIRTDYLNTISSNRKNINKDLNPVVKKLWGSVKIKEKDINYKELLKDALIEKHLKN